MIKIMKDRWNDNKETLRERLSRDKNLQYCDYSYLVRLAFEVIYNNHPNCIHPLDVEHITKIDNGDWQGTLLFLIPEECYQPSESEYLMTYVWYGSCSGCDTLMGIQSENYDDIPSSEQVDAYMQLCLNIVQNTIKPYNIGWRCSEEYEAVDYAKE